MNYNQTDNWDAWAAPKQVPVAWMEPDGSLMYVSEVSNPSQPTKTAVPLYAAPPAAPAPVVPATFVVPGFAQWRDGSAAPVVPLTDERLQKHAMRAGDCPPGSMVVLLSSLRRMLSAAPVVREPIIDEMDAVASRYAHKLALDLECVLSDYNGKWWDAAMQTLGAYREAMNAIHERESPTHMGEPVLPPKNCGRPDCPAGGYGPCAPCEREHSGG